MTKKNFNTFKVNELNGGINVQFYPGEIQDKQAVDITNWNFDGNKLVNSAGLIEKYNDELDEPINGILEDGDDLYYTHGGKCYRNGVEIISGLPNKKTHISTWFTYVLFTFETGDEEPRYWDGVTLNTKTGLGTPKYNTVYNGKWILGGYGDDNIYFSKTASPNNPTDIIDFSTYSGGAQSVGGNSQGQITGFKIGENGLYVFKRKEIWYSNSEKDTGSTFSFIFNKITSNGAINQYSIEEVEQEIFYLSGVEGDLSVRRLGYEQNLTTLRDTAVSREIGPLLNSFTGDLSSATMSYKYPNLKVFLPTRNVGSGVNDIALVYNVENKSWTKETNKTCSVSTKGFLGNAFESIIYDDDIGVGALGGTQEGEYISKAYPFGEAVDLKEFGGIEIAGRMDSQMILTVGVFIDGALVDTREITTDGIITGTLGTRTLGNTVLGGDNVSSAPLDFKEKIELYDEGQNIQLSFSYSGIGRVQISNVNFEFKKINSYYDYY